MMVSTERAAKVWKEGKFWKSFNRDSRGVPRQKVKRSISKRCGEVSLSW